MVSQDMIQFPIQVIKTRAKNYMLPNINGEDYPHNICALCLNCKITVWSGGLIFYSIYCCRVCLYNESDREMRHLQLRGRVIGASDRKNSSADDRGRRRSGELGQTIRARPFSDARSPRRSARSIRQSAGTSHAYSAQDRPDVRELEPARSTHNATGRLNARPVWRPH